MLIVCFDSLPSLPIVYFPSTSNAIPTMADLEALETIVLLKEEGVWDRVLECVDDPYESLRL
jgi:hypothetical protein